MPRWRIRQRILLPQVARYALPGLSNVWQMSLKDSALVSVTGIVGLMRASQIAAGSTRDYFSFYLVGGACYLLLTLLSNRAFLLAESRPGRAWLLLRQVVDRWQQDRWLAPDIARAVAQIKAHRADALVE